MKSVSSRRANIVIALVVIVVIGFVTTLLVSNYISQVRLVNAAQKQFIYIVEKQAMAVGYFFSERKKDLTELSHSRELLAYFENEALGMSPKYGLTTSLLEVQEYCSTMMHSRQLGTRKIYDWIAVTQPDGTTGIMTFPEEKTTESLDVLNVLSDSLEEQEKLVFVKKGKTIHAVLWLPYLLKQQTRGYIVANIPLASMLDNLIDAKDIRAESRAYIFSVDDKILYPEDEIVSFALLNTILKAENNNSGMLHISNSGTVAENLSLVYATIYDSDLLLLNMFPEEGLLTGVKPRNILLIMFLLSILVLGGSGLVFRKNIQKQFLARQVEESRRNALEIQSRNEELSAEISGRKKVEQALEKANKEIVEANAVLNSMLKSATEFVIAAVDEQYRVIHFNPTAERILGVRAEDVMGKRVVDIHSLKNVDHTRFDRGIRIAIDEGKYEYDILREDVHGAEQRLHAVVMPIFDDSTTIVGFIFFALDTTEKYNAEEKLRLSEERYRTLLENIPDIVFTIDQHFIVRDITLPESVSYGLQAKEIIGKPFKGFVHKDDRRHIFILTQEDIKNRSTYRRGLRFRIIPETSGFHWVELNIHYQYNSEGSFLAINGVLRDITEQKVLEEQLIRTERLAAVGQLSASIAHEINSPLAGISALLGLVRKNIREDKETLENVELIHKAFESIALTVQNLLNLCRPGVGSSRKTSLNTIIQNTVALSRAYLKKKGIAIEMELSSAVLRFDCFPQEIGQVFLNFINNSVEAMEDRSKTVTKKITIQTTASSDKITVEYRDTGPGIAEEDFDKLFDPFFTKKKTFGIGVGLAICHDIIVRNNGTMQVLASGSGVHFVIDFSIPTRKRNKRINAK